MSFQILLSFFLFVNLPLLTDGPAIDQALSQTEQVTPTMTIPAATATLAPTATSLPTETPAPLSINTVEPARVTDVTGGTLTILGAGFTSDSYVRLVGYGILSTSILNNGAATAVIPPGVAQGSYGVEVADDTRSAVWSGTVEIVGAPAPTAIPGPTNTPSAGDLSVGAVEPSEVVKSTGATITIFGGGFTSDSIVRLAGVGALQTTYLSDTALTALVPPDLPPFQFDLQVIRGNDVATWGGKVTIFEPATPTPLFSGVSSDPVLTNPQLLIQNTSFDPAPVRPGEPFILSFELVNVGEEAASNLFITFNSPDVAVPAGNGNIQFLEEVPGSGGAPVTVAVPLVPLTSLTAGEYALNFQIDFQDEDGRSDSTTQSIGFTLGDIATPTPTPTATPAGQPRLILSTYAAEPALEPGGRFQLSMLISNMGNAEANNISLTLGGEGGAQLSPFAMINAGNVAFIPNIQPGEVVEITREMISDGRATAQSYNLPLAIDYEDVAQTKLQNLYVLSLLVENRPKFQVSFFEEPFAFVGEPVDLPVEIINIGRNLVNVSTIELVTASGTPIENGSLFAGPLDGGTSVTLDGVLFPEEAGNETVVVNISYLDEFNQARTFSAELPLEVSDFGGGGFGDPDGPIDSGFDNSGFGPGGEAEGFVPAESPLRLPLLIGGAIIALAFIGLLLSRFRSS